MSRPPPRSTLSHTLSPYTSLFLSGRAGVAASLADRDVAAVSLVEGAERLAEVGEHLDDIVRRRGRRNTRIVQIADIGVDAVVDIGRGAAFLVAEGIVGDQSHRQRVGRFEEKLSAQEIAVAVVEDRKSTRLNSRH